MPRDINADSRALGADLWEAGLKPWADRLDAVLEGGSTSSEILMGLRWTLDQLLDQERALPVGLRERATTLRFEIDNSLG